MLKFDLFGIKITIKIEAIIFSGAISIGSENGTDIKEFLSYITYVFCIRCVNKDFNFISYRNFL